jgi:predicted  nucleic acid-binding Zn-ribbon protein
MVSVASSDITRVKYTGFDFDTSFDELQARLQVKFAAEFNDFALSSLGIVLLDLQAYGNDTLSFYLDRRATDVYLETARTRGAVSRLTRQLGYKMGAAVASSVDLTVAIRVAVPFAVTIPKGFQFQGPNNTIFETARDVTYPAFSGLSNPQIVSCYEGETVTETFVSTGLPNQVFQLARVPRGKFVVQNSVTVTVNGSPFVEKQFLEFTASDQFEFAANDDPPTIRFGDGTSGTIPTNGATILVTYVASNGVKGLVLKNTIIRSVLPLVVSFQTIQLSIDNPAPSVGGADPEDINHAKTFAPLVYKTRQVAVTLSDHRSLASAFADPLFGRVAVAQAIPSRGATSDLTIQTLTSQIADLADDPITTVTAATASASQSVTEIDAEVSNLNDDLSDIADKNTNIDNALASCKLDVRNIKGKATEAASVATSVSTDASSGKSTTNALIAPPAISTTTSLAFNGATRTITRASGSWIADSVVPGMKVKITGALLQTQSVFTVLSVTASDIVCVITDVVATEPANTSATASVDIPDNDRLSTETRVALESLWDKISAEGNSISSLTAVIGSSADTALTNISTAQDELADVGLDVTTASTILKTASDRLTEITADKANITAQLSAISSVVVDTSSHTADLCTQIQTHVDTLLSADCKANLVTVPILTTDFSGFYTAPSVGLVQSLQTYLDGKKEVTQVVRVVSGEPFLVRAAISVRVGLRGVALTAGQRAVEAAIDSVLRGRVSSDLYVSELDEAVRLVAGVVFRNIAIEGHLLTDGVTVSASKLDTEGNLIISVGEIVTKGVVTVSTEVA